MLLEALIAIALLMALLVGWVKVQAAARALAEQHPELGPLRLQGSGCGGQGHGDAAPPPPPGGGVHVVRIADAATRRAAGVALTPATPATACDACENTACKGASA